MNKQLCNPNEHETYLSINDLPAPLHERCFAEEDGLREEETRVPRSQARLQEANTRISLELEFSESVIHWRLGNLK